ncbi:MAG: methylmalonyl Co-A mutase-associated GTPase MeaB [Chitinophagales bacterium]
MKINKNKKIKTTYTAKDLAKGILKQNKIILSKAITLLESTKPEHNKIAREVIEHILPHTGKSIRIGITGVPGVGKSTFIEAIGNYVLKDNRKLAVLAIDPSSKKNKGSILGDKTRMENISTHKDVFIRPSPAGNELGGVHRKTRETILLCEAAGFDTIFIETVGVGQSETAVSSMVDCLLLLMLAGAGDELQGIKRGIMEIADIVAVNKAENNNDKNANKAIRNYKNALHLLPENESGWITEVLSCSGLNNYNIESIWKLFIKYENHNKLKNYWKKKRTQQSKYWMHETINQSLNNIFYNNDTIKEKIKTTEKKVIEGKISSFKAADDLLNLFLKIKN